MENDVLQQILIELKSIKESQAVLERNVKEIKTDQQMNAFRFDKLDRNQAVIEQGQAQLQGDIDRLRQSVAVIENEHGRKINAIYDGYMNHQRAVERIEPLEEKAEEHDARIWAVEQAVKAI